MNRGVVTEKSFFDWEHIQERHSEQIGLKILYAQEVEYEQNKSNQMYEDDHLGDGGHEVENEEMKVDL